MRSASGSVSAQALFPLTAGMATGLLLWFHGTKRAGCSRWIALALIGQAAALQLIDAGPTVRYQHLISLPEMVSGIRPLALVALSVQSVAVASGLRRLSTVGADGSALRMPAWRWSLLVALSFALSATVSGEPSFYLQELLINTLIQAVGLGNLVLIGASVPEEDLVALASRVRRPWGTAKVPQQGILLAAIGAVVLSGVLSYVAYQRHPHVPDEVGYLYQARYFATGALVMSPPPTRDAFDMQMMTITPEKWYGIFPPGWPAVLALGVLAGAPWLVNPLLTGLSVLLAYVFVSGFFDRSTAVKTAFLLAVSPWQLLMGMSFMSHTLALALAILGAIGVMHARRGGGLGWALTAGICVGLVSLVRPMDGVVVALGFGLWTLWPGSDRPGRALLIMVIATVIVGSVQLAYNQEVTGEALRFPTSEYMEDTHGVGSNALGFGPGRGAGWTGVDPLPGHGPMDVLINSNLNLTVINVELHGWITASLIMLIFLFVASGAARREWGLLAGSTLVVAVYSLYWFSGGPDFAARYWFLVLVPWTVLTVRGCDCLGSRLDARWGVGTARRVWFAVAIASLMALLVFVPWRGVDKYFHYRGMQPGARAYLDDPRLEGALVLVRGENFPDFMSAAVYNEIGFPSSAPVFAWYGSEAMARDAIAAFPDRQVWILDGPTHTSDGFELSDGPISPRSIPPSR
jgi:hypothetical protein